MIQLGKRFLLYLTFVIAFAFVLDFVYTTYYNHPVKYLDKYAWLKSLDSNQHFDYALFGSSRCFRGLDPTQINKKTGLNGINLAYYSYGPLESKLMIKAFLKKYKPHQIFMEADYSYDITKPSKIAIETWLPYIKEEAVYSDLNEYGYSVDKNIPFFRYMKYDSFIGFRNVGTSILGKERIFQDRLGFYSYHGKMTKNNSFFDYSLKNEKNKHVEEIINFCALNKIAITFFTSPIYKSKLETDFLKQNLPCYIDFSNLINDPSCFSDPIHLNANGALIFTEKFVQECFN